MDTLVREGKVYEFGSCVLDPVRRTLTCSGARVTLSPTVFDALLYLVEHPGRVVSKDELLDAVWPRKVVEEANVSQTIYTLRKALSGAGAAEPIIVTAPGQGYRLAAPVRRRDLTDAADPAPEVQSASRISTPVHGVAWGQSGRTKRPRPVLSIAATGVVSLALALAGYGVWLAKRSRAPAAQPIVVLAAFQNLTKDPLFDRSLAKTLEVDLDQSPSITALSDRQVQDTLALMSRPKDTPLTETVAAEICARNNGQAVVEGAIAPLGADYLVTLNATDCANGRALDAEKTEVVGREAVIPALDRLIDRMRERLGESRDQIARFNVPLANEKTTSLAAIKAYSEGVWLANSGQSDQAQALYQQAIELDPNFAAAYASLAALDFNSGRKRAAKEAMDKAFGLRDTVNEELRLNIEILFNSLVSGDYNAVIRSAQAMTQIYPRQGSAWINLSNAENWLGHYAAAVDAGRHAVETAPGRESSYAVLARALMHAGQLDQAAEACRQAAAKGLAGGQIASLTAEIAIARNDAPGLARVLAAAHEKPYEAAILGIAARDAYRQGQIARGDSLYAQAAVLYAASGEPDESIPDHASDLAELGLRDRGRALAARAPDDADPMTYLLTLAELGERARAAAILESDLRGRPSDTLLNSVLKPELDAMAAIRSGHPRDAIADLRTASPYEARDNDAPYLRGEAFLAANDGPGAAVEFRKILDHPGVEPADVLRPLAQLGLARAYGLTHDGPKSRSAYRQFFADWRNADPDVPALKAARAEYAALRL
jgi:DNA-binding winged helix-turn-helix (wHTH) protein/tetratricopeptide (TPR) repeat protein